MSAFESVVSLIMVALFWFAIYKLVKETEVLENRITNLEERLLELNESLEEYLREK